MDILIAEDTSATRKILVHYLSMWGHNVVETCDGEDAWDRLQMPYAPRLAILDWMMPGLDGVDVCRRVRAVKTDDPPYLIILTAKDAKEDIVSALDSGANDYMTKPFTPSELRARINVGMRVLTLQRALADRVKELEVALERVQSLETLLPICMYCKKVRDDSNYWGNVEEYFSKYSGVQLSHGVCPECYEKHVRPQFAEFEKVEKKGP
jgi:sigma-B regulation protein RsbU (phosphoserine phosphatase)